LAVDKARRCAPRPFERLNRVLRDTAENFGLFAKSLHNDQTCRIGGWKAGLLISFNPPVLREGIVRRALALDE